ncbi:MAG TPA: hypothetical protein VE198_12080 [Actinoallomurus sp.]|nr:hypothetical protein [Actinoallomurus sp.]
MAGRRLALPDRIQPMSTGALGYDGADHAAGDSRGARRVRPSRPSPVARAGRTVPRLTATAGVRASIDAGVTAKVPM